MPTQHTRHHDPGFLLIAVWKLFRGVLLLAAGIWVLVVGRDGSSPVPHGTVVQQWLHHMRFAGAHKFIHRFLVHQNVIHEENLKWVGLLACLYSVKLFVEGIGLWFEKVWAQYLTVIFTSLFLPVTIYELIRRANFLRMTLLLVNILIVAYLIYRLRQRKQARALAQNTQNPV